MGGDGEQDGGTSGPSPNVPVNADKPREYEVEEIKSERVLDDFFKVDARTVRHWQFDGTWSKPQRTLVFERGDAAAALLYNPSERKVILVNQFRLPTRNEKLGRNGWLVETAAGMIKPGESPQACIIREIQAETGYQVTRLTPIADFFVSPGGTSEMIHLFYAEVRSIDQRSKGGGDKKEGEDIEVLPVQLDEFLQQLANRELQDAKLIIAGQWLRDRHSRQPGRARKGVKREFEIAGAPGKFVGYRTGDILDVDDIDVWVNPENTDMMMDRFFGRSVSATIRLHGAKKVPGAKEPRVEEDTIGDALKEEMKGRSFVRPGFVLQTQSGELKASHNVQRIFHVAAVRGLVGGEGLATSIETLEQCVTNVLVKMEELADWPPGKRIEPYKSVIFPMLGTGEGGFRVNEVAGPLVARAVQFFERRPTAHLKSVHFLAYSDADEATLRSVMTGLMPRLKDAAPGKGA